MRCVCRAVGVVNVNAVERGGGCCAGSDDDEGCCCCCWCGCWSEESREACDGSRREVSISARLGIGVCIDGGGGCDVRFEEEAKASQADFSSSRLGGN